MCINQFFKNQSNKRIVDDYIIKIYKQHEFKLNNKRRLWHIKNDKNLYHWITIGMGVGI
jgi:hypothetical protein